MGATSSNTDAAQAQRDLGLAVLEYTYAGLDRGEGLGYELRYAKSFFTGKIRPPTRHRAVGDAGKI